MHLRLSCFTHVPWELTDAFKSRLSKRLDSSYSHQKEPISHWPRQLHAGLQELSQVLVFSVLKTETVFCRLSAETWNDYFSNSPDHLQSCYDWEEWKKRESFSWEATRHFQGTWVLKEVNCRASDHALSGCVWISPICGGPASHGPSSLFWPLAFQSSPTSFFLAPAVTTSTQGLMMW